MEKKIKELQQACEDLKKEIGQRQLEGKTLKEDLESSARQVTIDKKEYDKLTEKMENLKVCAVRMKQDNVFYSVFQNLGTVLTLVLLNPDMPCLCKQCRFRSSQLIWNCTVSHYVF